MLRPWVRRRRRKLLLIIAVVCCMITIQSQWTVLVKIPITDVLEVDSTGEGGQGGGGKRPRVILPVPPSADFPVDRQTLDKPCSVIRMINYKGKKMALTGSPVCQWIQNPLAMADGKIYKYGEVFALLYDVIVHPERRHPGAKGGEEIEAVWGQHENEEYIQMKEGYFELPCSRTPEISFPGLKTSKKPDNYLNTWTKGLACNPNRTSDIIADVSGDVKQGDVIHSGNPKFVYDFDVISDKVILQQIDITSDAMDGLTLALQRNEYVNIYFVMLTIYNAFLVSLSLGVDPREGRILLVDAHPRGGLDSVFDVLFKGGVMRAGTLEAPTEFSAMAWVPVAYRSPLRQMKDPRVNYLEEFRQFVLEGYGLTEAEISRPLNCSALRVLFLWRRDYVAHPRNKGGKVSRKFLNEDELLQSVIQLLGPQHRVEGRQLDADDMASQLGRVAGTDILIGMHGAGLVHTLYLPPHAHLVEIYPKTFPAKHQPFKAIAGWRGLGYHTWQNKDKELEGELQATRVPKEVVLDMVKKATKKMCER